MKEELRSIVGRAPSTMSGMNLAREYLQSRILLLMQEEGAMIPLAFCGGTALRFLYGLPRFSEYLDFSMEKDMEDDGLVSLMDRLRRGMVRQGYDTGMKSRRVSAVESYLIRFPGLPYEMGLAAWQSQVLSIKVEVDTNPPEGAVLEVSIVRKFSIMRLQHHDRASLLAGKLHAVLTRSYPKGRDYYDLLWYLTAEGWPGPNMNLLRNALRQTGCGDEELESMDLRSMLEEIFRTVDWAAVRRDIEPFLEQPSEVEYLNEKDMTGLLGSSGMFRE